MLSCASCMCIEAIPERKGIAEVQHCAGMDEIWGKFPTSELFDRLSFASIVSAQPIKTK